MGISTVDFVTETAKQKFHFVQMMTQFSSKNKKQMELEVNFNNLNYLIFGKSFEKVSKRKVLILFHFLFLVLPDASLMTSQLANIQFEDRPSRQPCYTRVN